MAAWPVNNEEQRRNNGDGGGHAAGEKAVVVLVGHQHRPADMPLAATADMINSS